MWRQTLKICQRTIGTARPVAWGVGPHHPPPSLLGREGEGVEMVRCGEGGTVKYGEGGVVKYGEGGVVKYGEGGVIKYGKGGVSEGR